MMSRTQLKLEHIRVHFRSIFRNPKGIIFYIKGIIRTILLSLILIVLSNSITYAEQWTITAYCPCAKCCSSKYGYFFASGIPVTKEIDTVDMLYGACNILPFGTIVDIEHIGKLTIIDRGSSKYFDNQKHIDIFMWSHEEAIEFGKQLRAVEIIKRSN